jgi:hypothetical protein
MDLDLETFFLNGTQLQTFWLSCVVGVVIGMVYDVFRIFRVIIPHNDLLLAIEDIVLMTAYGIFTICFAFALMRGQIRFFFVMGNLIGFILWYFTLGNVIIQTVKRLRSYIIKFINLVTLPIRKILHAIYTLKKNLKNQQKNT